MRKSKITWWKGLLFLFFFLPCTLKAQQQGNLRGYIKDAQTGEFLPGASIYDTLSKSVGTLSGANGFFELKARYPVVLRISFMGYQPSFLNLTQAPDQALTIGLQQDQVTLREVIVQSETEKVQDQTLSLVKLNPRIVDYMPALAGESDPLKVLQLMPGISQGQEGTGDLFVRGGSPDQNLFLLDGIPVYNPNHLLGFVSVFNTDAIQQIDVHKSGFPARYGGRLSSIVDVQLKNGNTQEFGAKGTIGIVSTKLLLEGPIQKDKSSFLISGRRSNIDLYTKGLSRLLGDDLNEFSFYDLNAKINFQPSTKDHVSIGFYTGYDAYQSNFTDSRNVRSESFRVAWGNRTLSGRWFHAFSNGITSLTTAGLTNYELQVNAVSSDLVSDLRSVYRLSYGNSLQEYNLRQDYEKSWSKHQLSGGWYFNRREFSPGLVDFEVSIQDTVSNVSGIFEEPRLNSHEVGTYLEHTFSWKNWMVQYGAHLVAYRENEKTWFIPQPRLLARYNWATHFSTNLSFSRMAQMVHLLGNSGTGLPTDVWVPATDRERPQDSWMGSLGGQYIVPIKGKDLTITADLFYKKMDHLLDYYLGTDFFLNGPETNFLLEFNNSWQNQVTSGRGEAYGLELMLQRSIGKTTGWLSYTLSETTRQFELLNRGEVFPYRFDKRHDIAFFFHQLLKEKFKFSLVFVLQSGNRITLPEGSFLDYFDPQGMGGRPRPYLDIIENRNNYQLPAYHRLDLAFTHTKKKKWGEREWSLSVYNTYARQNPFFVYVSSDPVGRTRQAYQVSLFSIIPSLSYRFSFGKMYQK